jgi:hypothetical protein
VAVKLHFLTFLLSNFFTYYIKPIPLIYCIRNKRSFCTESVRILNPNVYNMLANCQKVATLSRAQIAGGTSYTTIFHICLLVSRKETGHYNI